MKRFALSFILLVFSVQPLLAVEEAELSQPIPVAQAGGGTYLVPFYDPEEMAKLQGLSGEPSVKIKLISPQWNEILSTPDVTVKYQLENYEVGQPVPGQHIHVILDNSPYEADYTPEGSILFRNVAEGTHTISVFAARKFHLSLKSEQAFDQATFHVVKNDGKNAPIPGEPELIYSRPKGSYSKADGSADNIMLDFYLRNVELSPTGYRVRAQADQQEPVYLSEWKPVILLKNPEVGDHTVTLELVDLDDEIVSGPFNSTARKFTVTE